jgi:hypothetical protein
VIISLNNILNLFLSIFSFGLYFNRFYGKTAYFGQVSYHSDLTLRIMTYECGLFGLFCLHRAFPFLTRDVVTPVKTKSRKCFCVSTCLQVGSWLMPRSATATEDIFKDFDCGLPSEV